MGKSSGGDAIDVPQGPSMGMYGQPGSPVMPSAPGEDDGFSKGKLAKGALGGLAQGLQQMGKLPQSKGAQVDLLSTAPPMMPIANDALQRYRDMLAQQGYGNY